MSIAEQNNAQIERLRSAISDAYTACNEKGATMPSSEIIENLGNCIRSIQGGVPFATGIVSNVTAGQTFSITGIKDEKTNKAFDVKGFIGYIEPTTATNYVSGGSKPATVAFIKTQYLDKVICIAAYSSAYSVRINPNSTTYITISGNSFTYKPPTSGMYHVMAATQWRWIAWG